MESLRESDALALIDAALQDMEPESELIVIVTARPRRALLACPHCERLVPVELVG